MHTTEYYETKYMWCATLSGRRMEKQKCTYLFIENKYRKDRANTNETGSLQSEREQGGKHGSEGGGKTEGTGGEE